MKITLDGKELTATAGRTILDAARSQGVDIPTLCHRDDCASGSTSCLVCLVKVAGRFVPACATRVEDGMVVESETEEVRKLRKASLELLLSDHRGDCFAPCQFGCPAGLDIPKMLREVGSGRPEDAIRTIKETIPLPAVLGRVCPKPCEKVCRRRGIDAPVEICAVKRHAADVDLARSDPYVPELAPPTGKRVVVVGAGPSGLSAAYYLVRLGHHVSLYAQGKKPGGRLRRSDDAELPESVLDAEIRTILNLPIDYYPQERLDWTDRASLAEIRRSFDAVLLCTGPCETEQLERSDFEREHGRLQVDSKTFTTSVPGIFATGTIFRARSTMVVRSVADGREAAYSVDRFLRSGKPHAADPLFAVKLGRLTSDELAAFAAANRIDVANDDRENGTNGREIQASREASRCLHCDCRGREKCRLLYYSKQYHADVRRFEAAKHEPFLIRRSGSVLFEPGKCIKCGLCIETTRRQAGEIGLTFIGRGFDVQIGVPFDEPLQKALERSAEEAVRVCPTAALTWDDAMPPSCENRDF